MRGEAITCIPQNEKARGFTDSWLRQIEE